MNDLRVGICGCTRLYHGELEGRKWVINAFRGEIVSSRVVFRLKEVCVPEDMQISTLLGMRCHFFVDMHYRKGLRQPYYTSVLLEDYVPHSRTGIEIPFSGWSLYAGWNSEAPVTTSELLKKMRYIITKMDRDDMYGWLIHLSPDVDPRPMSLRAEQWKDFKTRVCAKRQERIGVYHCYPACTENCH